jgi:hypothetical protein
VQVIGTPVTYWGGGLVAVAEVQIAGE